MESRSEISACKCRWYTDLSLQLVMSIAKVKRNHFQHVIQDIIASVQELIHTVPETKTGVANQIIWNNWHIKINKRSVLYRNWNQSGVQNISSIFNEQKKMLSFISFLPKTVPSKLQLSRILRANFCNTS